MATLETLASGLRDAADAAETVPLPVAAGGAAIAAAWALARFGGELTGLTKSEATVVIATIGAAQGFLGNTVASQLLNRIDRRTNILDVLPAITVSVVATVLAYAALLPGSPLGERWAAAIRRAGLA